MKNTKFSEMKIPRQIFKLAQTKGVWRIKCNEEITKCMMMGHFNIFTPQETTVGWPQITGG
jgi:hypothetical protein